MPPRGARRRRARLLRARARPRPAGARAALSQAAARRTLAPRSRRPVDFRVPAATTIKGADMEIVKKFGPYLAVELLLPGGTAVAILLYLIRERRIFSRAWSNWPQAIRLFNVNT